MGFVLLLFRAGGSGGPMPVAEGLPLPELRVAGWTNGGPVSSDALRDRVVVIDCWATWCGPCVASLPSLAALHQEYGPMGVQFIGLTDEKGSAELDAFIAAQQGFDWPVGHGARPTTDALGIAAIPTLIAYGKDGLVAWSGHNVGQLRGVLDRLVLE